MNHTPLQQDLFAPTIAQQFEAWRETRGGKHLLRHAYRITAGLVRRLPRGRQLSVKLVWELMRHRYVWILDGFKRRGVAVEKVDGFALNNNFTAHVARHIMSHRSDWSGLFELREIGKVRKKRRVIVIEESRSLAA